MALKLNTGKIAFPIEFDNGDIQNIYFNPNDPDLGARMIAANKKITKRMDELKIDDVDLSPEGDPIDISNLDNLSDLTVEQSDYLEKKATQIAEVMEKTKNIIFEELNTAFDSDVSSVVFKYCSPFAIVNGKYYIMYFLEAITPEIRKIVDKSNAEAQKRMQKHIGKYVK